MNSDVNDLYVRSVEGCLKSREALYLQFKDMIWWVASKMKVTEQFNLSELAGEGDAIFMRIIENNLFDPSKGVKFGTYLHRCLYDRMIKYKLRNECQITNKSRKVLGFVMESINFNLGDESSANDTHEGNLWIKKEDTTRNMDEDLLIRCVESLTEKEKDTIFAHFKIKGDTNDVIKKYRVSRQALDQVRYKAIHKLKKKVKELVALQG